MATIGRPAAAAEPPPGQECCMCGDYGLAGELFRCKLCLFRSQHRYCSNVYPKAESYTVCNWCLLLVTTRRDSSAGKVHGSPNSSSSSKKSGDDGGAGKRGDFKLRVMKKSLAVSPSPSPAGRKRVVSNGRVEEMVVIRRTKSEEMSVKNNGNGNENSKIRKQVYRNKVKRYKLLEEVSN